VTAPRSVLTCPVQINKLNAFRFRKISEVGFINKVKFTVRYSSDSEQRSVRRCK